MKYKFIFIFSISVNFLIACSYFYLKYLKYPNYYRNTIKIIEQSTPSDCDIILLGDSFFSWYSWPVTNSFHKVANYGLGGTTTLEWINKLQEVNDLPADTVVIWLGINDLINGEPVDSVVRRYNTILNNLKLSRKVTFPLEIFTTLENKMINGRHLNDLIEETNQKLKSTQILFSLFNNVNDSFRNHKLYNEDGLHLSIIGFQIADVTLSALLDHE